MRRFLQEALPFVLGLILAYAFGWSLKDLVWSMWLSSFIVGVVYIFWGTLRTQFHREKKWIAAVGFSIFPIVFFLIHFGGFHLGHAHFIALFLSLPSAEQFANYFWVLPLAFWANHTLFIPSEKFKPELIYGNVVKLHFLIFALAFLSMLEIKSFWVYIAVYAWFFWPLNLNSKKTEKQNQVILKESVQ